MEDKASQNMVIVVTAGLIFSTFVVEINAGFCETFCGITCHSSLVFPELCYLACMRNCHRSDVLALPELGHCKLGCMASTCFNPRSDVKKVEADKEKVEACVDSCSESCQKSYVSH